MSTKESAPGIKIGTSLRALDYEVSPSKCAAVARATVVAEFLG